jgi:hypothetical protein
MAISSQSHGIGRDRAEGCAAARAHEISVERVIAATELRWKGCFGYLRLVLAKVTITSFYYE